MADNKVAVTISRYWNQPQIRTHISGEGIAMALLIEDYEHALALEMGLDPAQVAAASRTVLRKVKEESAKVV